MVRDVRHTDKWVPSTIAQKLGPVTYQVDIGSVNIVKCHIDQLTQCLAPQPVVSETNETQTIEDNFQYPESTEPPRPGPVGDNHQPHYPQKDHLTE